MKSMNIQSKYCPFSSPIKILITYFPLLTVPDDDNPQVKTAFISDGEEDNEAIELIKPRKKKKDLGLNLDLDDDGNDAEQVIKASEK